MRSILSALSLLAFLPGTAGSQDSRTTESLRSELLVDGVSCGFVRKWSGGEARAPVIVGVTALGGFTKKQIGAPQYSPLTVELDVPPPASILTLMNQTLTNTPVRKTVRINLLDINNRPVRGLEANQCVLTKIAFPNVDAASREAAPLVLTFQPESTKSVAGSPSTTRTENTRTTTPSFRFAFEDSTDTSRVLKVEGVTASLRETRAEAGQQRDYANNAFVLEISNILVALPEANGERWTDWFQDFVIKGNNDDSREKTGSLTYLSADGQKTLMTVKLKNVGIVALTSDVVQQAGSGTVRRLKAELYAEGMEVSGPPAGPTGAATPPPPTDAPPPTATPPPAAPPPPTAPPPPAAPAPAAPPPPAAPAANTSKDDQGARDPADFPRPEGTVRKSYSSNRNKIISTEMATYSATPTLPRLEAIFDDLLKQGGWDATSRNESGDSRKGTHSIVLIFKKGPRTGQLTLGQAKDGTTEYTIVLNEPADVVRATRPSIDLNPPPPAAPLTPRGPAKPPLNPAPAPNPVPATAPVAPAEAAPTAKMTGFDPKVHGFRFANDYRNSVFGPPIKVVTSGLCGGMSYTALDYYLARVDIPKQDFRPSHNTPLQTYLYRRQESSLLVSLDNWANYELNPLGTRTLEIFNWGLRERLAELRASIDRGMPIPLGLKGTTAGFGHDHQVLAIGYDMGRYKGDVGDYKEELKIFLCDPNYPGEIITMFPDQAKMEFTYKGRETVRWRSYFTDVNYIKMAPPAIANPIDPLANRDGLMHALQCRFTTGEEELRGGTLQVNLAIVFHDGSRQEYPNISQGGRWLPEYSETVEVILSKPRKFEDIRFLEINTTNKVGPRGDRWDMKSLSINVIGGGTTRYMPFKEPPAHKFVGLPLQIVPK